MITSRAPWEGLAVIGPTIATLARLGRHDCQAQQLLSRSSSRMQHQRCRMRAHHTLCRLLTNAEQPLRTVSYLARAPDPLTSSLVAICSRAPVSPFKSCRVVCQELLSRERLGDLLKPYQGSNIGCAKNVKAAGARSASEACSCALTTCVF
jgi:hypothetical protein